MGEQKSNVGDNILKTLMLGFVKMTKGIFKGLSKAQKKKDEKNKPNE